MGSCVLLLWLQIGTDQRSAVRRQPVLFFCVINQGIFAALVSIMGQQQGQHQHIHQRRSPVQQGSKHIPMIIGGLAYHMLWGTAVAL